jgi:penicillin-binding protein 1A
MARREPHAHKRPHSESRHPAARLVPEDAPKRRNRWALRLSLTIGAIWAILAGALISHWVAEIPDSANLLSYDPGNDITLLDAKGRLIARRGLVRSAAIGVGELPAYVGNAFIAVEDRRFRSHFGIDIRGLGRALVTDIKAASFVQGGSTLTQQLAKNLFLKPDRTLKRKIEEAILALLLERRYSKDQILTLYLNHVYFGAGVYGIEAASERFYNKPARDLSLIEAAELAGSVKAPSRYNPAADPEASFERAQVVLAAMEDSGFIDAKARFAAARVRPQIARATATPDSGYFVDYALSLIPGFVGKPAERLIVETTLDLDLEHAAERALDDGLSKTGVKLAASQGALVAMAPDGAVRALVGGQSYDDSPFDRATEARRQPGSAFKPFVYLAALEHGHLPSDTVFDGPVAIGKWHPDNYEGEYEGRITLAHALAHSSNSAAVQLTNEVGPDTVVSVAHRLGIAAPLHAVPSIALGTSEVSPLDLVGGYAAFANGGDGVIPYVIVRIRTASGRVLYQRKGAGLGRVIDEENEGEMTQMMMGTVTEGTGKAAALDNREVAGKTGTSQDYRDAWFIGFTAEYVCGVWIGNDDGKPMKRAVGGGLPAAIFKTFMTRAEDGIEPQPLPGLQYVASAADGEIVLDSVDVPVEAPGVARAAKPDAAKPASPRDPAQDEAGSESKSELLDHFQQVLDKLF